jgi:hypothetical protein
MGGSVIDADDVCPCVERCRMFASKPRKEPPMLVPLWLTAETVPAVFVRLTHAEAV